MNRFGLQARTFPQLAELRELPPRTLEILQQRYREYVAKTNEILKKLAVVDHDAAHHVYSELRALKSELPHALGAVKSYEIFFAHLGGRIPTAESALSEQVKRDYGSHDAFLAEIKSTARASRGWVAVGYDPDLRKLMVLLGDTPEDLTVWNMAPVMVLDVSERACAADFGSDRGRYVDALLHNTDWTVVERNLDRALDLQPADGPN